jgi:hypothetical protein
MGVASAALMPYTRKVTEANQCSPDSLLLVPTSKREQFQQQQVTGKLVGQDAHFMRKDVMLSMAPRIYIGASY